MKHFLPYDKGMLIFNTLRAELLKAKMNMY